MYNSRRWLNGLLATAVAVAGFASVAAAPATAAPASAVAVATPPPAALLELAGGTVVDTADPHRGTPPALNKFKGKADKGTSAPKLSPKLNGGSAKAGGVTTMSVCSPACYYYGGFFDNHTKPGASINMAVAKPAMDSLGAHSLAEIAASKVTSNGQTQHVEIGWTRDPVVNANSGCTPQPACKDDPHLFTFAWVNGSGLCYNGCGFVKNTATVQQVGKTVIGALNTSVRAGILYFQGNWWVRWGNEWVGYWPASLWTNAGVNDFTDTTQQVVFGEIAAWDTTTCTDMGNGVFPVLSPPAGATLGSFNALDAAGTGTLRAFNGGLTVTVPARWNALAASAYTVRYGGTGGC